jgi:hypothetical protein
VIGVHKVGAIPSQVFNRIPGFGADIFRVASDQAVFTVRLIPNGVNIEALLARRKKGLELRLPLLAKAITHAESIFG